MTLHRELRQGALAVVLLAGVFLGAIGCAQGSELPPASSSESPQIGKLLSVRKVLRTPYFTSRYPQIHYYMLYFAIRVSERTYCSEYETPVLDEIDDLFSAKGKDVEFMLNGKRLILRTPKGRKIKARLVPPSSCCRTDIVPLQD
jgi:hypothetical protein